mgnify:CR=1 FL=1
MATERTYGQQEGVWGSLRRASFSRMHLYYRDYNSEDRIYFSNSTVHLVFGSKGAVDGSGALSVKKQPRPRNTII